MTTAATERYVTSEMEDGIAVLTLTRAEKRNALSLELMRELIDELGSVARSEARVVVIRALGPAFSAGHDLREMLSRDVAAYRGIFDVCVRLMTVLQEIPQPVIAEVAGVATAAGCQLVASCDLAIASTDAKFATPGVRIGLVLHDADGRADARDRPQARDGDAADGRLHRCADGRRLGPDQSRGPARPAARPRSGRSRAR